MMGHETGRWRSPYLSIFVNGRPGTLLGWCIVTSRQKGLHLFRTWAKVLAAISPTSVFTTACVEQSCTDSQSLVVLSLYSYCWLLHYYTGVQRYTTLYTHSWQNVYCAENCLVACIVPLVWASGMQDMKQALTNWMRTQMQPKFHLVLLLKYKEGPVCLHEFCKRFGMLM